MKTMTTTATPVVRVANEFGFNDVLAATFSGRRTKNGPVEVFTVNYPRRGFNCKDGSVSITNRSGNWGNKPLIPFYERVTDFKALTIVTEAGDLMVWEHKA